MRADPCRARVQPRARHDDAHDRALHRTRSPRDVRARGGRGCTTSAPATCDGPGRPAQPPTSTSSGSSGRCATTRADAAWVGLGIRRRAAPRSPSCASGWGWSSSDRVRRVMRLLGDKIAAKRLAERVGVPVVPWSGGAVQTAAEAVRDRRRALGFPLLVKATAGGGGRGIREVRRRDGAARAPSSRAAPRRRRRSATARSSSSGEIDAARHVEVQVIADRHGTTWALGVRDCTVQRRHQKVLEEAPSPALSAAEDTALRAAAVRLVRGAGYESAGPSSSSSTRPRRTALFMEVNARLQVEHPVTECTTGTRSREAAAPRGPRRPARRRRAAGRPCGHAIEVRLNAEDPEQRLRAGARESIELLRLPGGPGIRVDRGIDEGDDVAPQFDSMIAKIVAHGRDRDEALARLRRALADTTVVVRGGTTNRAFLLGLLDRPEVARGDVRHRLARPADRRGCTSCRAAAPRWRCWRPRSRSTRPRRPSSCAASSPRRRGGGPRCGPRSATAPSCGSAAPRIRSTCAASARRLPDRRRGPLDRRRDRAVGPLRALAHRGRAPAPRRVRGRGRHASRRGGRRSRTASRATRAASCGRRRRRWCWRSRSRRATWWRRATASPCSRR